MVADSSMNDVLNFWKSIDFDEGGRVINVVEVDDFKCDKKDCLYSVFCNCKGDGKKAIGKWCVYYAEKFVESLNKGDGKNEK